MTPEFNRRRFLQSGLVVSACRLARLDLANANQPSAAADADAIIDTHVYVGRWPFRQVSSDDPAELVATLRRNNVSQAWAGTFDGLLHKDIGGANQRLVETCRAAGGDFLIPFGTVNPTLPDWEEDVRRCHEVFHMPGVRLHPNYHDYTLDDPRFARLLAIAADRKLIVQLVCWLDDEIHPYMRGLTKQVAPAPLADMAKDIREVRLVVANAISTYKNLDTLLQDLAALPNVAIDFGRMPSSAGVDGLVRIVAADCVVFGSGAPLMSVETAKDAVQESSLKENEKSAVFAGNARRILRDSKLRSE